MNMFKSVFAAFAIAGVGMVCLGGAASAATCPAVTSGSPLAATACERGSTNNDKLNVGPGKNALQVNLDTLFDLDSWVFLGKDNLAGSESDSNPINLGLSGGLKRGSFVIPSSLWNAYDAFALVLKGGAGNTTEPNYIAYRITSARGTYSSPFFNLNNGNTKDISHISLYGATVAAVPLPAGGLLLLGALAGFVGLRRRKTA